MALENRRVSKRMKFRTLLVTVVVWLLLVAALGYWRMFYAWRWGSFGVFFLEYMPALVLLLVVLVVFQSLYFRRQGQFETRHTRLQHALRALSAVIEAFTVTVK